MEHREVNYAVRTYLGAALRRRTPTATACSMLTAHLERIYHLYHHTNKEYHTMKTAFTPTTFLACPLSDKEAVQAEKWFTEVQADWFNHLGNALLTGHKVSLTYDNAHSSFIASLTGTEHSADNAGMCISARSDDPMYAILAVLFKHTVIYDAGKWTTRRSASRFT
jgi:hypothetical protein